MADEYEDVGFAVWPLLSCPHDEQLAPTTPNQLDVNAPCENCDDREENWLCLMCLQVFCSRHRMGHGVLHFEQSQHALALSFTDLSVWCYACDSYVNHPRFQPIKLLVHRLKFGEDMPGGSH